MNAEHDKKATEIATAAIHNMVRLRDELVEALEALADGRLDGMAPQLVTAACHEITSCLVALAGMVAEVALGPDPQFNMQRVKVYRKMLRDLPDNPDPSKFGCRLTSVDAADFVKGDAGDN